MRKRRQFLRAGAQETSGCQYFWLTTLSSVWQPEQARTSAENQQDTKCAVSSAHLFISTSTVCCTLTQFRVCVRLNLKCVSTVNLLVWQAATHKTNRQLGPAG